METCYIILAGSRLERVQRLGQLAALNKLLNADIKAHVHGLVSGIWPIEIHWLGGDVFRVVCILGPDASASPLLAPHRAGAITPSARIYVQAAGRETLREAKEICVIPGRSWHVKPSNAKIGNGGFPFLLNHVERLQMAEKVVDRAMSVQRRASVQSGVFDAFWTKYLHGERFLVHGDKMELRRHQNMWEQRLTSPPPPPQELDLSREAEWPAPAAAPAAAPPPPPPPFEGLVTPAMIAAHNGAPNADDCGSTVSSILSETDTIASMSLKIEDVQNLWKITIGSPGTGGPVWAGGLSPIQMKYPGLREDAAPAWNQSHDLFADQPWRQPGAAAPPHAWGGVLVCM